MKEHLPRLVAWETTRACPLACIHCRAEAQPHPDPAQLSTREGKSLLSDIGSGAKPIVILTGGEPLMRSDIFELAAYGTSLGLRMTISPDDGRLLTPLAVARLKDAGIQRVSFSLHFPDPSTNDHFARSPGAYAAAMRGLGNLKAGGLPFQINTTVTARNREDLPRLLELVERLGAEAWHVFFLVPTGRGKQMEQEGMTPAQYEETLSWLYDQQSTSPVFIKETCAPHFMRIKHRRDKEQGLGHPASRSGAGLAGRSQGCMAGDGFVFISHVGEVQPCGYFPVSAGNVRQAGFWEIYRTSRLFESLRDPARLSGKCGRCEYRGLCGGCRARAYAATGDYLGEEPYCLYQPRGIVATSQAFEPTG